MISHFDRRRCLRQALASVAAQTWRDFEVVVVSDAGPESSRALVEAFAAAHAGAFETRFVRRSGNGGVAATRNSGAAASRGALLAWLDDDDLWRPGHLAALVRAFGQSPGAALAYGDAQVWRMVPADDATGRAKDGDLDPSAWRIAGRRGLAVPFDAEDLRRDDFIVPGGMLHGRSLLDELGPFDEGLFVSDDWDWLLRLLAARGPAAFARAAGVVVDVRIWDAPGVANLSADFGTRRREALATLERRHRTLPLEPKTFWDVAGAYAARAT